MEGQREVQEHGLVEFHRNEIRLVEEEERAKLRHHAVRCGAYVGRSNTVFKQRSKAQTVSEEGSNE